MEAGIEALKWTSEENVTKFEHLEEEERLVSSHECSVGIVMQSKKVNK